MRPFIHLGTESHNSSRYVCRECRRCKKNHLFQQFVFCHWHYISNVEKMLDYLKLSQQADSLISECGKSLSWSSISATRSCRICIIWSFRMLTIDKSSSLHSNEVYFLPMKDKKEKIIKMTKKQHVFAYKKLQTYYP